MAAARRYGLPISGPIATSGAHFLASLIFVRNLPAAEFGIFSFVLVIVPFCMSIMAALLVLPVNNALAASPPERARIEAACLKMNAILTALAGIVLFGLLIAARAPIMREIAKRALHHNAAAVILAHNHPTGNTEPSEADIILTRELCRALAMLDVIVLDHMIVGRGHVYGFLEHGKM